MGVWVMGFVLSSKLAAARFGFTSDRSQPSFGPREGGRLAKQKLNRSLLQVGGCYDGLYKPAAQVQSAPDHLAREMGGLALPLATGKPAAQVLERRALSLNSGWRLLGKPAAPFLAIGGC